MPSRPAPQSDLDDTAPVTPHQRSPATRLVMRWGGLVALVAFSLVAASLIVEHAFGSIALPKHVKLPSSSQVFDARGRLIASYSDEVTRFLINTNELPGYVGHAVVAAEDRDFYEHEGVSVKGIARAAWENLTNQEVRQGGSTISQQYIKNAVLKDPTRSVERKLKEVVLSVKLERRYSKEQILGFYLNTVYFGRGAYGIEAAARAYFKKHARELTLAQAAYLGGIIPSPDRYQPDQEPKAAKARRDYVLDAMVDEGYIGARRARKASRGRVVLADGANVPRERRSPAAYFVEWLRKEYLYPRFGDCLYRCGLKIHTTLDLNMQRAAERAVADVLGDSAPEAALVSMTPRGAVRAFVGGRAFDNVRKARGFNHASDGKRQPGSAFKPFTLLAALEQDISTDSRFPGYSPKTIYDDECVGPNGMWEPENYDGGSYGTLTLDEATALSVNTVYAELIAEIGPTEVADALQRLGFRGPGKRGRVPAHCSLALGALDVSPLQMARAFAAFAGGGRLPEVMPLHYVLDSDGDCLHKYLPRKRLKCRHSSIAQPTRKVDDDDAYVLTDALTGVVESGTGTAAAIGRPVAGKTGTTQDHRDAWFAGYVPQLTTVVWMGYPVEPGRDRKLGTADDFTPLMQYCGVPARCRPVNGIEVTGGSWPAEIWARYMSAALANVPVEYFPVADDFPDIVLNPPPPPPPPEPPKPPKPPERDGKDKDKDRKDRGKDKDGGD